MSYEFRVYTILIAWSCIQAVPFKEPQTRDSRVTVGRSPDPTEKSLDCPGIS